MDNGVSHFLHSSYIFCQTASCRIYHIHFLHLFIVYTKHFTRKFEKKSVLFEMARDSLGHRRKLHRVTFAMHFVHIVYCSIHGGFILSLNSKRGAFFSEEAIVETCAVSRLFFSPSIYRLLRGRFSLNSKRKAFFFEVAREHGYRLAQSHF